MPQGSLPRVAPSRIGKFGYILTGIAMKTHWLILLSALLIAALMMHGQEAAPPSVDLFPEQEEENPAPRRRQTVLSCRN